MQTSSILNTTTDSVIAELLELDVDPLGRPLEDPDAIRAGIPAWHPRNDDDDDAGGGDDDDAGGDDDDAGDAGDDDGDDDDDSDDDEDDDDDKSPDARARRAEKAAAKANRELRELKRGQASAQRKADEKAGRFEKLYKETLAEKEALEERIERDGQERLAVAALAKLGSKNPTRHVKLLDLDDIEDEASAERAAKRLKREDKDLFRDAATRQKRGGGNRDEDDDEDDDGDRSSRSNGRSKSKPVGIARIRRGYEGSGSD